jgi:hypothetical protein
MRRMGFFGILGWIIGVWALPALGSTQAYYRFEGTGTAASLTDSSANGNTATTVSSPVYSSSVATSPIPQTGQTNTSALLLAHASNQYATAPDSSSLDFSPTQAITIEGWVKLNTLATGTGSGQPRAYVVLKKVIPSADTTLNYSFIAQDADLTGTNIGPHTDTSGNQLAFEYGSSGVTETITSSLSITDKNWHFISIAFDPTSGNVRFTDDAATDAFTISSLPTPVGFVSNQSLLIGGHVNSANVLDYTTDGSIDELRISSGFLATNQLLNAPEPSALGVICLGSIALLHRRRVAR